MLQKSWVGSWEWRVKETVRIKEIALLCDSCCPHTTWVREDPVAGGGEATGNGENGYHWLFNINALRPKNLCSKAYIFKTNNTWL